MSETRKVHVFQIQLVGAICAELDRQNPGVLINLDAMNAIIRAADDIVEAARQGLSLPNNPT